MKKTDLREILNLVKDKMMRAPNSACGLFWSDTTQSTQNGSDVDNPDVYEPVGIYAVSEYSVGEHPGVTTRYAVGEED